MFKDPLAFLFDLDGTLSHSEPSIEKSWAIFAEELNMTAPPLNEIHGFPAIDSINKYVPGLDQASQDRLAQRMEDLEVETADLISPINGTLELMQFINSNKIPWTIVTSGTHRLASARMKALGLKLPENAITFESVQRGKPDPEPYIKAAYLVQRPIHHSLILEDSKTGITSAQSSGAWVLAIPHIVDIQEDERTMVVKSLVGLDFREVDDLYRKRSVV